MDFVKGKKKYRSVQVQSDPPMGDRRLFPFRAEMKSFSSLAPGKCLFLSFQPRGVERDGQHFV